MRIGLQVDLCPHLAQEQFGGQVGRTDAVLPQPVARARVQLHLAGRRLPPTQVLRIDARLGGHHRHGQVDALATEHLLDLGNPQQVAVQVVLGVGLSGKLLGRVEPALLTDHQAGRTFGKQAVAQRGPDIPCGGAQRKGPIELVLVGRRQFAVGPVFLGRLEWRTGSGKRPETRHRDQRCQQVEGNGGIG